MKKILFALLFVAFGGGTALYAGEPTPVKPDEKKAEVIKNADGKTDEKAEPMTPAVAKAKDTLANEMAGLKKAREEAEEAAKKEALAIEEAKAVKEIEAQAALVRALRMEAQYRKAESERRAQRALEPPAEDKKKKSPKIDEILDLINK
jgi:hypothetical protein